MNKNELEKGDNQNLKKQERKNDKKNSFAIKKEYFGGGTILAPNGTILSFTDLKKI